MYFYRLLDCLREDYPAVLGVLGETRFHNLVTDYLLEHPPAHYSLRHAGVRLPEFLRRHPLAREHPFLADLARLEAAILDSFDAADTPVLSAAALASLPADSWAAARFQPTASVQILDLEWNADAVWEVAVAAEAATEAGSAGACEAARLEAVSVQVWRQQLRVFHRRLQALEHRCLSLLLEGASFAAICGAVGEESDAESAAAAALRMLQQWLGEGLIASVGRPGS